MIVSYFLVLRLMSLFSLVARSFSHYSLTYLRIFFYDAPGLCSDRHHDKVVTLTSSLIFFLATWIAYLVIFFRVNVNHDEEVTSISNEISNQICLTNIYHVILCVLVRVRVLALFKHDFLLKNYYVCEVLNRPRFRSYSYLVIHVHYDCGSTCDLLDLTHDYAFHLQTGLNFSLD